MVGPKVMECTIRKPEKYKRHMGRAGIEPESEFGSATIVNTVHALSLACNIFRLDSARSKTQ